MAEVSPGVWRIRYWAEGPDGYRRRSVTVRGTRREATERRAQLMVEHGGDAPCPTVGQCWERWYLPELVRMVSEGERSEQTADQYKSRWKCHIGPAWSDVPADQVRPLAVQQWISSMPRSVAEQSSQLLRNILAYAVRYECIAQNPLDARYVMPSRSTSYERDRTTWDASGLVSIWQGARGGWAEPAVLAMAFGGARVAESLGVIAEEVELESVDGVPLALVPLRNQIRGAGIADERLKNRWSTRVAVIPGPPGERMAELAREVGTGWMCYDGLGGPMSKYALRREWPHIVRASGAHDGLMKNLRASWETVLRWDLGIAPWVSEPLMGHVALSGGAVTAYHYDRPHVEQLAREVASAYAKHPIFDGLA